MTATGESVVGASPSDGWAPIGSWSGERPIEVDQSNESVVVGDAAVVKRFVFTTPGNERPMVLPAHLVAAGFEEMPAPLGNAGGSTRTVSRRSRRSRPTCPRRGTDGTGTSSCSSARSMTDRSMRSSRPPRSARSPLASTPRSRRRPTCCRRRARRQAQTSSRDGGGAPKPISTPRSPRSTATKGRASASARRRSAKSSRGSGSGDDRDPDPRRSPRRAVPQVARWARGVGPRRGPARSGHLEGPPAKDVASLRAIPRSRRQDRGTTASGSVDRVDPGCVRCLRGGVSRRARRPRRLSAVRRAAVASAPRRTGAARVRLRRPVPPDVALCPRSRARALLEERST